MGFIEQFEAEQPGVAEIVVGTFADSRTLPTIKSDPDVGLAFVEIVIAILSRVEPARAALLSLPAGLSEEEIFEVILDQAKQAADAIPDDALRTWHLAVLPEGLEEMADALPLDAIRYGGIRIRAGYALRAALEPEFAAARSAR